jgi:hypothetical protein
MTQDKIIKVVQLETIKILQNGFLQLQDLLSDITRDIGEQIEELEDKIND